VVGDRAKHDDDAFSPQWEENFLVGKPEVRAEQRVVQEG